MGPRKLLKEGVITKAKGGKRLRAFLCSDVLVLTDENAKALYRMVRVLIDGTGPKFTLLLLASRFRFQNWT